MTSVLGNIVEMLVYSAVYMIIVLVSLKVVGAVFASDFEKKIAEENNIALAVICACILLGIAILVASVLK
ncbi:MAG TPA: DUF350 domain-containing protein [Syntrophorhabdaceae bacterium]|nr:DUF350 domain-containing protein [Syntrophorhabdaceae bacterium]